MAAKKVKLNEEQLERAEYIKEFYGSKEGLNDTACQQIAVLTDTLFDEAVKDGEESPDGNADEYIESAIADFKAKKNRVYIKSEQKERKKPERIRKVDNEKGYLLELFKKALESEEIEVTGTKTETEISFRYNSNEYTVKLTKHRPKK